MPTNGEHLLIQQAREGDLEAFTKLVSKYQNDLFSLVLRILGREDDAWDTVQETFVHLIDHLKNFEGRSTFKTYLFRIGTNLSLNRLRKRKREPLRLQEETSEEGKFSHPEFIAPWRENPEVLAQEKETREILERSLNSLEEKYRIVFLLRDIEELSTEEVAEILDLSPANVKVRLHRARLFLREQLTRAFGEEDRQLSHTVQEPQE